MRIDDKYKWLARDEDGELWAHESKPVFLNGMWDTNKDDNKLIEESDKSFSFIGSNDEEPFMINIEPIIGSYEQNNPTIDVVNKPSHYIGINGLEMEEVLENFLPRFEDGYVSHRVGSATEYLLRSPLKNGIEDIKKAKRNLEQVIAYEEGKVEQEVSEPTNDPYNDFMKCLRAIVIPEVSDINKVKSYYAGNNFND